MSPIYSGAMMIEHITQRGMNAARNAYLNDGNVVPKIDRRTNDVAINRHIDPALRALVARRNPKTPFATDCDARITRNKRLRKTRFIKRARQLLRAKYPRVYLP